MGLANNLSNYARAKGRQSGRMEVERKYKSFGVGKKSAGSASSDVVTIDSEELSEFENFLELFQISLNRMEIIKILKRVLKPVVKATQQEINKIEMNSKNSTGNLWESIGMITGKSKEFVNVQVGPRVRGRFKGFHGAFLEFGTDKRVNKKGASRGAAKPHPFMKPAFDKTYGAVKSDFEREIAKYVEHKADSIL